MQKLLFWLIQQHGIKSFQTYQRVYLQKVRYLLNIIDLQKDYSSHDSIPDTCTTARLFNTRRQDIWWCQLLARQLRFQMSFPSLGGGGGGGGGDARIRILGHPVSPHQCYLSSSKPTLYTLYIDFLKPRERGYRDTRHLVIQNIQTETIVC
jgi:hypothetical protein